MRLYVLLAVAILSPGSAGAADWYTGAKPASPDDDWIVSVDSSTDITTQRSYFGDVVVTGAPIGTLDESGVRLRLDGLAGRYSYVSTDGGRNINGTQVSGAALVGYEWVTPGLSFAAYLGADIRTNTLSQGDPGNPVVGTSIGAKGQLQAYATPSPRTMVDFNASYASNFSAYFARLRGGYLVAPGIYVGPEVAALGDAFFNQERIGAHVGGLRTGPLQLAFAAGYLYDRVRGAGGYATVDARLGF